MANALNLFAFLATNYTNCTNFGFSPAKNFRVIREIRGRYFADNHYPEFFKSIIDIHVLLELKNS